jgi:hypothetical protein
LQDSEQAIFWGIYDRLNDRFLIRWLYRNNKQESAIMLTDHAKNELRKGFVPLHDATMEPAPEAFYRSENMRKGQQINWKSHECLDTNQVKTKLVLNSQHNDPIRKLGFDSEKGVPVHFHFSCVLVRVCKIYWLRKSNDQVHRFRTYEQCTFFFT